MTANPIFFHQGINDLQTEADRKAQRTIFYCLQKNFPHVPIIGEEVKSLYILYSTNR